MTFEVDTSDKVMCAGGGCAQRDKCLRYIKRGHWKWASFDIERKQYVGPCVHRIWFFKKVA